MAARYCPDQRLAIIITAVPEPITVALGVFGGLFLVGTVGRSERLQKLFAKPAPVIN